MTPGPSRSASAHRPAEAAAAQGEQVLLEEAIVEQQEAIIGGTATTGYGAVGIVYSSTDYVCTGFLVSPRVVITAAHCFDGGRKPLAFYTGAGAAVARPSQVPTIKNLQKHAVAAWGKHPGACAAFVVSCPHDIAYVALKKPVAGVKPLAFGVGLPGSSKDKCTIVGYGLNSWTRGQGTGGLKRVGRADVDDVDYLSRYAYSSIETDPGPNLANNGDSGGPLICSGNAVGVFSAMWWNAGGTVYRNRYTGTNGAHRTWINARIAEHP